MLKFGWLSICAVALAACVQAHVSTPPQPDRAPVDAAIEDVVARGAFPFLYVRVE